MRTIKNFFDLLRHINIILSKQNFELKLLMFPGPGLGGRLQAREQPPGGGELRVGAAVDRRLHLAPVPLASGAVPPSKPPGERAEREDAAGEVQHAAGGGSGQQEGRLRQDAAAGPEGNASVTS